MVVTALQSMALVTFGLHAALFWDEVAFSPPSWAVLSVCCWSGFVLAKGGWSALTANDARRFGFGVLAAVAFLQFLQWDGEFEVSSMTFELPHFAVELLIILPCCQIICSRLKVLVTPQVGVEAWGCLGRAGGVGLGVRERGFWERSPEQRHFLPRVRRNLRVLAFLSGLTALAAFNATAVPLYLERQATAAAATPAVMLIGSRASTWLVAPPGTVAATNASAAELALLPAVHARLNAYFGPRHMPGQQQGQVGLGGHSAQMGGSSRNPQTLPTFSPTSDVDDFWFGFERYMRYERQLTPYDALLSACHSFADAFKFLRHNVLDGERLTLSELKDVFLRRFDFRVTTKAEDARDDLQKGRVKMDLAKGVEEYAARFLERVTVAGFTPGLDLKHDFMLMPFFRDGLIDKLQSKCVLDGDRKPFTRLMDLISWASSQERVLRAEKVLAPPSVPTVAYAAQTPRPKIRTQTATRARQQRAATRASAPAAATARADPQPSGRDGWQPANRRGSKRAADGPALNPLQLTRIRHSSGRLLSMVEKEMCDTRDTGATHCFIAKALADRLGLSLRPSSLAPVRLADASKCDAVGECVVPLRLGTFSTEIRVHVLPSLTSSADLVLGQTFLKRFCVQMTPHLGTLHLLRPSGRTAVIRALNAPDPGDPEPRELPPLEEARIAAAVRADTWFQDAANVTIKALLPATPDQWMEQCAATGATPTCPMCQRGIQLQAAPQAAPAAAGAPERAMPPRLGAPGEAVGPVQAEAHATGPVALPQQQPQERAGPVAGHNGSANVFVSFMCDSVTAITTAARKWVSPPGDGGQRHQLLCLAASSHHPPSLDAALAHCGTVIEADALESAITAGDLAACRRLFETEGCDWDRQRVPEAAGHSGSLPVCEWLVDTVPGRALNLPNYLLSAACYAGHEHVVEWALQRTAGEDDDQRWSFGWMAAAAAGGQVQLLRQLAARFPLDLEAPGKGTYVLDAVAFGCPLAVLQQYYEPLGGLLLEEAVQDKQVLLLSAAASPTPDWAAKCDWLWAQWRGAVGEWDEEELDVMEQMAELMQRPDFPRRLQLLASRGLGDLGSGAEHWSSVFRRAAVIGADLPLLQHLHQQAWRPSTGPRTRCFE
eukprot:XP_001694309.1 predicted protein [Chlamydomonas reinhardtii]